jgi:hypothetical protein
MQRKPGPTAVVEAMGQGSERGGVVATGTAGAVGNLHRLVGLIEVLSVRILVAGDAALATCRHWTEQFLDAAEATTLGVGFRTAGMTALAGSRAMGAGEGKRREAFVGEGCRQLVERRR